ncbi:MAG: hypothetical protein H6765_03320 [Candidatus Peribacteria bacterium]|nr:MAG: hypothetical protein H6765_03320 [Candidatus Peribacteria bacterium]
MRSRFFTSELSIAAWQEKLHQYFGEEQVIFEKPLLSDFSTYLQEVDFHSQKEMDQAILDLLPPKEVVLSTNFLLQDAPNVFELAPAERVVVFKHLFGLLGIDEAKEKLAEKRREIQTTIKVKQDNSLLDSKLAQHVDLLVQAAERMRSLQTSISREFALLLDEFWQLPFLQDINLIKESLRVNDLQLDIFPQHVESAISTYVSQKQASYNQQQ